MLDLLIIGAGLTGLTAAHVAASAGLSVRVVAKGMGATHWHAGTIDVLGYRLGTNALVAQPLDAVDELVQQNEDHPYALVQTTGLRKALTSFVDLTKAIGLPYQGAAESGRNLLLPSPAGAPRPVFLAPAAQVAGTLASEQPMLIVGFEGLRDFYPRLVAENLTAQGRPARAALLPTSLITERRDFNTVWLAEFLDDPATTARLAEALASLAQPGERIGLPAILGLHDHAGVMQRLQDATGAPVFEIPTLPPSVPGIRLTDALRRHLDGLGVRVEIGMDVVSFAREGRSIRWVETQTSSPRPLRHRAKHFLLATGGILGGGIDSDHTGRVWETIFDLPLTTPQSRAHWFRPLFLDPRGQPVYQGGVRVNSSFQPVNGSGDGPIYANLWAAGGTLTGADPIHERSLEGIAVATGMAAAEEIGRSVAE